MLTIWALLAVLLIAAFSFVIDRLADLKSAAAEARFPPEGQLLKVGGRSVHAVVSGSGPDLVLIHGASGNTRDFSMALSKELTDRYRVIALDRPGLGWTDRVSDRLKSLWTTKAESPADQARLLARAARELGAEAPIVLGHSYGGAVAMAWALQDPSASLVIVSGATMPWDGGLDPLYPIIASIPGGLILVPLISAFAPANFVDASVKAIFAPQPVPLGYQTGIGVGLTLRRNSLRANARQVNGLKRHVIAMSARYSEIDVPAEILHGTADTIVPAKIHAEPLSKTLPHANLTLLDGIGHMPHHVAIPDVVAAIDRAAARAGLR